MIQGGQRHQRFDSQQHHQHHQHHSITRIRRSICCIDEYTRACTKSEKWLAHAPWKILSQAQAGVGLG
jgi:hypothetical protein